jgi:hypothetical protein
MKELAGNYLAERGGSCFLPASLQAAMATSGLLPVPEAPQFKLQLNVAYHSGGRHRQLIEQVANYFGGVEV